jgi:hypothetical protein
LEDFVSDHAFVAKGTQFQLTTKFHQAKFHKGVDFSVWISGVGPLNIQPSSFAGDADFSYAEINGPAHFEGSVFHKEANFGRMQVRGAAYFSCYFYENAPANVPSFSRTTFEGYTTFAHAIIDGTAYFRGVEFGDIANFERAVIGGHALFQPLASDARRPFVRVHFKKDASFLAAQVGANAEFDGAQFDGEACFERITINRNALFRSFHDKTDLVQTTFSGTTLFLGAEIRGSAEFFGALFAGHSTFASVQVHGNAIFDDSFDDDIVGPVSFMSKADFDDAHFQQQLFFTKALFHDTADFSNSEVEAVALFSDVEFKADAKFTTGHFKNQANFERTKFLENVDFRDLRIDGTALFNEAEFHKDSTFKGARFKSLHFKNTVFTSAGVTGRFILRRRTPGNADLRGLNYEQIECDIDKLLNCFGPYDRQPYALLEKSIRSTGQDREADDIYYEARTQDGLQLWERVFKQREYKDLPRAISNEFQKKVFRFGIRPYRLIVYCGIVLSLGFFIFWNEGSVMRKDKRDRGERDDATLSLQAGEALNVSLRQFVPILELPIAGDYVPSDRRAPSPLGSLGLSFAGYATIHRLFGFLLIPLGLASLTGMIHRRKPQ